MATKKTGKKGPKAPKKRSKVRTCATDCRPRTKGLQPGETRRYQSGKKRLRLVRDK
jgi:phage gp45-like